MLVAASMFFVVAACPEAFSWAVRNLISNRQPITTHWNGSTAKT